MCEPSDSGSRTVSRRRLLVAAPVAAGALALGAGPPRNLRVAATTAGLEVVPRDEWGPDLPIAAPIPEEPDVRFLLVHHSVSPNTYAEADVLGLLRAIHRFHTGERGWPDVAYNFFVDRFGRVWEGRTGSLATQVAGDATGGSQGYAQLCCFLGEHSHEPPSAPAQEAMGRLLGWLADRAGVDVAPGATATFVSRGSNLHPAGTQVTTGTIAGHREMSRTACPGDAAQALVDDGTFAALAAAASRASGTTTSTTSPTTSTVPPTTTAPATTGAPPATDGGEVAPPVHDNGAGGGGAPLWAMGTGAAAAGALAVATAGVVRRRQAVAGRRHPHGS